MPIELAAALLPVLTGAVLKIADGTLQRAGEDLYERTKAFFGRLRNATTGNPQDAKTLKTFEKLPEDYQEEMKTLLDRYLDQDQTLRNQAHQLLASKGAQQLVIELKATEATEMTGANKIKATQTDTRIDLQAEKAGKMLGVADYSDEPTPSPAAKTEP